MRVNAIDESVDEAVSASVSKLIVAARRWLSHGVDQRCFSSQVSLSAPDAWLYAYCCASTILSLVLAALLLRQRTETTREAWALPCLNTTRALAAAKADNQMSQAKALVGGEVKRVNEQMSTLSQGDKEFATASGATVVSATPPRSRQAIPAALAASIISRRRESRDELTPSSPHRRSMAASIISRRRESRDELTPSSPHRRSMARVMASVMASDLTNDLTSDPPPTPPPRASRPKPRLPARRPSLEHVVRGDASHAHPRSPLARDRSSLAHDGSLLDALKTSMAARRLSMMESPAESPFASPLASRFGSPLASPLSSPFASPYRTELSRSKPMTTSATAAATATAAPHHLHRTAAAWGGDARCERFPHRRAPPATLPLDERAPAAALPLQKGARNARNTLQRIRSKGAPEAAVLANTAKDNTTTSKHCYNDDKPDTTTTITNDSTATPDVPLTPLQADLSASGSGEHGIEVAVCEQAEREAAAGELLAVGDPELIQRPQAAHEAAPCSMRRDESCAAEGPPERRCRAPSSPTSGSSCRTRAGSPSSTTRASRRPWR